MRIKKLASLIKDAGNAMLHTKFDEDGEATEQWAGNGYAVYQLQRLPILTAESFASVLDFTAKDMEKVTIQESSIENLRMNLEDNDPEEKPVTTLPMQISFNGYDYQPLFSESRNRVHLINTELFAPLDGVTYQLHERNANGIPYIAVKTGLLLIAVIQPARCHTNDLFVDTLKQIYQDVNPRHTRYETLKKRGENSDYDPEYDPDQTNL